MTTALTHNIRVDAGADLSVSIRTNSDLSGQTVTGTMAKEYGYSNDSVQLSCSASGNSLTISLTHAQTGNLEPGVWVYDVSATSSSNVVTRVVQGRAHVSPAALP